MYNTTVVESIKSLDAMSAALEKVAADDRYYNTEYGTYLDQMSYVFRKHSAELREIEYMIGGF